MSVDHHRHSAMDTGAAELHHKHQVGDVQQAVSWEELSRVRSQVSDLAQMVRTLQEQLAAERAVVAAMQAGISGQALIAALRSEASRMTETEEYFRIGIALDGLADEIEKQ